METILLATDGSEYARVAAEQAIELAAAEDATLHAICVVDRRRHEEHALSSAKLNTIAAEDEAIACIEAVRALATSSGVAVAGSIRHGTPHESIIEYGEEVGADLIVLGEHGAHEEHFPGVGQQVSKRSDRDVIVVTVEE
ncbi:MAG: universal stress protein [archaeon]